jgi:phosphomannomutase
MKLSRIGNLMASSRVGFGTSGARGLVTDMTDEVCFAYTLAFLQAVAPSAHRVALAHDLRPSSPRIARACAAAIRQAGMRVDFCGPVPTPALAYYAQCHGLAALMVTGSHIPFDRNGIKFYKASGEILKEDESAISAAVMPLPEEISPADLPAIDPAARDRYAARYLRFFEPGRLAGMRIGFYEHSSVARDILRGVLESLGAEVISLGRTDDFVPIDTEAVSESNARQARLWARQHCLDALVSTDGDGDRPLIGDESGQWLRGDVVGLLCARYLGIGTVVTPVSSNTAIEKSGAFAAVVRTRIGSPYVIAGMEPMIREGGAGVAGFEANGGFLLGTRVERGGRSLEPLPTRDAVLPILALLAMARERGCALSRLPAGLPRRFTASDRIQGIPTERSSGLIGQLAASGEAIDELLGPLCGKSASLDRIDGLRIGFENGEIVHLRPSGNAPELRCYAEADTPERAEALTRECLDRVSAVLTEGKD